MKKRLYLLVVATMVAALLAGCMVPAQAALQEGLPEETRQTETRPASVGGSSRSAVSVKTAGAEPTEKALCAVCGEYDCDDGIYCDDAHEKAENLREQENRKNGTPCQVCGDYDCDDGIYCDDAHEKAENLREQENRKNGTPCQVCGDYDCDDGIYCDDWDDHDDHDDWDDRDDHDDHRHGHHHDD